jgi:hypothetical protein
MAGSKKPMIIMSVVAAGCVCLVVLVVGGVILFRSGDEDGKGASGPSNTIVAGKDQSNNDLVVCLATHNNALTPGHIKGDKCIIPMDGKAVEAGTWDTFRPEKKVGWTRTRPAQPIAMGNTAKGETQYLCRGPVGLGTPRVPGFTVDGSVCWVTDLKASKKVVDVWPQKPGYTGTPFEWATYV